MTFMKQGFVCFFKPKIICARHSKWSKKRSGYGHGWLLIPHFDPYMLLLPQQELYAIPDQIANLWKNVYIYLWSVIVHNELSKNSCLISTSKKNNICSLALQVHIQTCHLN